MRPRRAVAFQSISRNASPGWYSRKLSNSLPAPRSRRRRSPASRSVLRFASVPYSSTAERSGNTRTSAPAGTR